MKSSTFRPFSRFAAATALLVLPAVAWSVPYTSSDRDVLVPNTGIWASNGVTLGGTSFINLGLQGVGRIPASAIDSSSGESIGSVSDMQITNWTQNSNGSYSGVFNFLPDRGYNSGSTYSNYAARINTFDFNFTPYTSNTATTQQNQITLTFTGSTRFTYDNDNDPATAPVYTTGLQASPTPGSVLGEPIPVASVATTNSDGTVASRLTFDAEALAFDNRPGKEGTGWVGDEYGAYIYHFNANKEIDGIVAIPDAAIPSSPLGSTNFAADPPADGRRVNQGFEGVALSPDGTKLFGLLQSATIQDSGSGNQGRSNTRLFVYDVSGTDTPSAAAHEYVIQLPRIDDNGVAGGQAVNRTGAQSSVLAINDHQLLILSRDGNGRGATGSPVFKSILLADLDGATDINGLYDADGSAVAPGGVLNASVTPISWTEALNMLGGLGSVPSELGKFGVNLNPAPGDVNSLSEKWEALALVSALDVDAPSDYFLFIGNDNDFLTQTGEFLQADGTLQGYNAGLENDTMILAYRVRISEIPEPSTLGLLIPGVLMAAASRRQRRAR